MTETESFKQKLNDSYDAMIFMGNRLDHLKREITDLKQILHTTIEFYETEIEELEKNRKPTRYKIKKRA